MPSRMIATAPLLPSSAGHWEGRQHPFGRMVRTASTSTALSDGPISHISLPVSRGSGDPVLKPKTRSVEPDKKTSSPAKVILPPVQTRIPHHSSVVPAPRRVPPPALDLVNRAPHMHMSGIPRRPAAPPIITTDLPDPPRTRVYTPMTSSMPSSVSPLASNKQRSSLSPTPPTSGQTMASPKVTRTLPRPPPTLLPATVAARPPVDRYATSTRAFERINDRTGVDARVQHPSMRRKVPDHHEVLTHSRPLPRESSNPAVDKHSVDHMFRRRGP